MDVGVGGEHDAGEESHLGVPQAVVSCESPAERLTAKVGPFESLDAKCLAGIRLR
jgi:hypothetical protein